MRAHFRTRGRMLMGGEREGGEDNSLWKKGGKGIGRKKLKGGEDEDDFKNILLDKKLIEKKDQ